MVGFEKARKCLVFIFVCVCCMHATLVSADASADAHDHQMSEAEQGVEQMLKLMGTPQQVSKLADDVLRLNSERFNLDGLSEDHQALVSGFNKDVMVLVNRVLNWKNLKSIYIQAYQNQLSSEEVAAVTRFLETSAGQKFVSAQSQASGEIETMTTHLVQQDVVAPLNALIEKLQQSLIEMRKNSSANQPTKP